MGLMTGLLFDKTESLRVAFEEAKPKVPAVLKDAFKIDLPSTPTHVRFNADEQVVIVASSHGIRILDASTLARKVGTVETRC